ncbi:tannase/feruloyl esterase family alpha/beta hydrolase [Nocardioides sp. GY 10127]|uniref:tannase/feruloyl esterase family alpha/beta hydrolase n=1 Tax=Nocardioides sp. GY 10127 TaxID=2569762 RepID=UPI0010A8F5D1|nr:tannase/feruloyl esterase family alpha/beta hydrolase [Nocardioides sp. GY 10127]TIC82677.1 tannase/feruloyl esterase family alpha/beta hydrolase [Nocardioides sp. GY 10127]
MHTSHHGSRRSAVAVLTSATLALLVAGALVLTGGTAQAGGGHGGSGPATPVVVDEDGLLVLPELAPVMSCDDVATMDLDDAADAPVTVTATEVVDDGETAPYCQVTGTIAPADTIVVRLPLEGWTQRYLQTGCGGLCGSSNISYTQTEGCTVVEDGTIASATTDMGHQGGNDGSWAADAQAALDFSYRGVHVTSLVAKEMITQFYGHAPRFSYFDGCSDGGREALMEAQRYPDDFDGIAAGAPASNMVVQNTYHHAWNVLTNLDDDGQYILLADKLPAIHDAVLAACDGLDGVVDGVLDDPRRCDFDPMTMLCADGVDDSSCLTAEEAGVVQRLHDGATTPSGKRLEVAISHEWGSELEWTLFIPTAQGETVGSQRFVLGYIKALAFTNTTLDDPQLTDLDFSEKGFWRTVQSSSYQSALDPDLSAFRASGGRLVLWHGWNDQHISPQNTLAYWHAMKQAMGSGNVARFARLYLFPGMAHCGDGAGPHSTDVLTPTMAWVESGRAPDALIASSTDDDGTVTRTRPVYPYPTVARYDGTGSTDDAANFVPFTPRGAEPGPGYSWLGQHLFSSSYQQTCTVVDGKIVCSPRRTWLTAMLHPKHGKHGKHARAATV